MPSIHAWSWSQMSRRVVAIHPCLVARATKAFMNHSCRPTCAIEFSYSGHIFVLQQPYSEINEGGGWNRNRNRELNEIRWISGIFQILSWRSRIWILHWMPRQGFFDMFSPGMQMKMVTFDDVILQDDLIAMGREGRRKQLLPYGIHCCSCALDKSMIKLGVTCLHFARQLHCRWFMPAEISIQSTKGRSQVTSQETTFGFSAKKMMSNRMLRKNFGAFWCFWCFVLFGKTYYSCCIDEEFEYIWCYICLYVSAKAARTMKTCDMQSNHLD